MKCTNPNCNRSIGLVAHRRDWFGRRLYCTRKCRVFLWPTIQSGRRKNGTLRPTSSVSSTGREGNTVDMIDRHDHMSVCALT
jgi:hypothetical protein